MRKGKLKRLSKGKKLYLDEEEEEMYDAVQSIRMALSESGLPGSHIRTKCSRATEDSSALQIELQTVARMLCNIAFFM